MNASQVKEMLSENDIFTLLQEMGSDPELEGSVINSRTRCHNPAHEGKHKLYYYHSSKSFRCYTGCGSMDIFGLIQKAYDMDFYNAFRYICLKFGINMNQDSQSISNMIDQSYFKKFNQKIESISLTPLSEKILNSFLPIYHNSWLEDGISVCSMKKFGIRFSVSNNQIIIPHYDENHQLVGVRARNLNREIVEEGKKYMPIYYKGQTLKHPTGACLYGLDKNKEAIEKYKTVILFESEKSVLQLDTFNPEKSIGVCISGSSLTSHQLQILKNYDIDEVIIALDKEFDEIGTDREKFYAKKVIEVFASKLVPYYRTSVIWDVENLLDEKDSPTDKGREVFDKLFKSRIFL